MHAAADEQQGQPMDEAADEVQVDAEIAGLRVVELRVQEDAESAGEEPVDGAAVGNLTDANQATPAEALGHWSYF